MAASASATESPICVTVFVRVSNFPASNPIRHFRFGEMSPANFRSDFAKAKAILDQRIARPVVDLQEAVHAVAARATVESCCCAATGAVTQHNTAVRTAQWARARQNDIAEIPIGRTSGETERTGGTVRSGLVTEDDSAAGQIVR